jgi:hypothetical protein
MSDDDKEYLRSKLNNEGFEYGLLYYSSWKQINDEKFHELLSEYKRLIRFIKFLLKDGNLEKILNKNKSIKKL